MRKDRNRARGFGDREGEKVNTFTYISNERLDAQEVSDLFYHSGPVIFQI